MEDFNIIVSSWPSAGGTTVSLVLAEKFKLKYIYAGGVLKEWARRMGYDPTTNRVHEWEELYGDAWDIFWEDYIIDKFEKETSLLCEGKTAGFLLPTGKAFEVMVTASTEVRAQRASGDMRSETIENRDKILQERWMRLFNVDIFSIEGINSNYDLLIDNSQMSIAESLITIYKTLTPWLEKQGIEKGLDLAELEVEFKEMEKTFWDDSHSGISGKERLKQKLSEQNLYYSNEQIFADFAQFPAEKLTGLPQEMVEAFNT